MNIRLMKGCFIVLGLTLIAASGCSGSDDVKESSALIRGTINVDEQLDSSGDFSGIELLITDRSMVSGNQDTLFYSITDSTGNFEETVKFQESGIYQMAILRNNNLFGVQNFILAPNDTISFNATLPDLASSSSLTSSENDLYQTVERVDRNFNRVARFINAGAVSADSVELELAKWSDIYWDVYQKYPGTYASMVAGNSSVTVARSWNDSLMVERSEQLLESEGFLRSSTRNVLSEYFAETGGIEEVLRFYEKLEALAKNERQKMEVRIDRIDFLYDSSLTVEANEYLSQFREFHSDNPDAMEWAENKSYDLEFLSPGSVFPDFGFSTLAGDSISSQSLKGSPYLLEVTRLDNSLYQQQYERTVAIHQIYSNFGLKIITVPLAVSPVALRAFYEERGMIWTVAQPGSFDTEEFIERFNVNQVPTRFLVNDKGEMVRRYVGNEYDDIVRGLQLIITQNNQQQ